tara:strand:- start:57 stop:452 length:396 start_codon:yes stop_codon:yes gene_type:complete
MLALWEKLPSLLRWVLLFPVVFICILLIGILANLLNYYERDGILFQLWRPPFIAVIYLYLIGELAPKFNKGLVLGLIIIRSLLIPGFMIGITLKYFDVIHTRLPIGELALDLIAEVITLIVSIWYLKTEFD